MPPDDSNKGSGGLPCTVNLSRETRFASRRIPPLMTESTVGFAAESPRRHGSVELPSVEPLSASEALFTTTAPVYRPGQTPMVSTVEAAARPALSDLRSWCAH